MPRSARPRAPVAGADNAPAAGEPTGTVRSPSVGRTSGDGRDAGDGRASGDGRGAGDDGADVAGEVATDAEFTDVGARAEDDVDADAADPADDDEADADEAGLADDDAGLHEGVAVSGHPAGRRFGTVALAAAIVIGLLLGFAAGWLAPRLTTPGDDSPEAGFARDMSTHHAQAVEMGLIAWQRATSPTAQKMGVDIATAQQGDIGTMQTWLRQWNLAPTGSQPVMAWMPEGTAALGPDGLMPGMASPAQMTKLRAATGKDVDILFLQLMIRHHLGGIHMADGILETTDDPEVVEVARVMKTNQQTELSNLTAELTRLGGTLLPTN